MEPSQALPVWPLVATWLLAAVSALAVLRNANGRRRRFGEAPGSLHPVSWAVVVLLFWLLGLVFYAVAARGQDRRARRG